MKITIERILIIGLLIVIIVLYIRSCHKDTGVITVMPILRSTTQKVDNNGNSYTEIKGTIYTQAQMKVITDSIQKTLGKGKVQIVTQSVTKIDTFLKQDTLYVDANTGYIYVADSQKDIQLSYTGNWKLDTGNFHIRLTPDTCTSITTIKRRLFKGPEMTTNLYHTNKLFTPTLGYSYTVQPAYDKFKLDGYIGCQTEFSRFYVAAGLIGQYFVTRRTSVGISYQYLYDGTIFTKSLTGRLRYTLIRF